MLAQARNAAECTGVTLQLIECNAMDILFENEFDAAICLCEGALTLLGSDDDPFERDQQVLTNICRALKPGGKFITTVLNAYRKIREATDEDVAAGKLDPVTLVEAMVETVETDNGPLDLIVHERGYTPPEFIRMLTCAGFTVDHIYGGTAGDWGRRQVKLDEMEFMAITHT
jgi:SAM-dependent methyltransferase